MSSQDTSAAVIAVGDFGPVYFRWLRAVMGLGETTWTQFRLLSALEIESPKTMGSLAEALDVTPRAVTKLVGTLEDDGLVARSAHPRDRRLVLVSLTSKGEVHCREYLPPRMAAIGAAFEDLSDTDRNDLVRILRSVENSIERRLSHRQAP